MVVDVLVSFFVVALQMGDVSGGVLHQPQCFDGDIDHGYNLDIFGQGVSKCDGGIGDDLKVEAVSAVYVTGYYVEKTEIEPFFGNSCLFFGSS
jgi:hypothetical protein